MAGIKAAAGGSRLGLLEALRDLIADELDSGSVPPRDMAALIRQIKDLSADIEALSARKGGDRVSTAAATADAPLRVAS